MDQNNGGILGKINTPTTSVASGVWSLDSQFEAQSSSIWPLAFPQTTIANSCRFSGGNDYLRTTGFGTPTSSRKMTLSFWCKRSGFGGNDRILTADTSGSNNNRDSILFSSNTLNLFLDNAVPGHLKTNRLFRDPSAWYHIVIAIDTTQSTDTNRIKIYVNGVQETSFDSSGDGIVYPSQNYDILGFGQNRENTIGADSTNGGDNDFLDGYLTEYYFIDGQQLEPTSFGAFNPVTSIWEPIAYAGTYGNNGFRLDFADSSALGNDVSGNDNDFTVNNLTSIDQSSDTCSNNFAVMNPLAITNSANTFSEGNLKITTPSSATSYNQATIGVSSGKWYWEVKYVSDTDGSNNYARIGIADIDPPNTGGLGETEGIAYEAINGNRKIRGTPASYGNTYAPGDIIGVALNLDDNELTFYKNGTAQNSGTAIDISSYTPKTGVWHPAFGYDDGSYSGVFEANFGSPSFSISSSNADGNGYGNFEYAVPSGYYALNTKNLAEFG
jgi:hypothetical protein